jgi:hypothetical protein
MYFDDLTPEEQVLVNTQFDPELEKRASDYVDELEESYSEDTIKTAEACADLGVEMAIKIAAELEEGYKREKEKEEDDEEDKKEVKEAAVRGAIIFENTMAALEKLGEERYGDSNIYLEEMVKQSGKAGYFKNLMNQASKYIKGTGKKVKQHFSGVASKAKSGYKDIKGGAEWYGAGRRNVAKAKAAKKPGKDALNRALKGQIGKKKGLERMGGGAKKMLPALGYGTLGLGGIGAGAYGTKKYLDRR